MKDAACRLWTNSKWHASLAIIHNKNTSLENFIPPMEILRKITCFPFIQKLRVCSGEKNNLEHLLLPLISPLSSTRSKGEKSFLGQGKRTCRDGYMCKCAQHLSYWLVASAQGSQHIGRWQDRREPTVNFMVSFIIFFKVRFLLLGKGNSNLKVTCAICLSSDIVQSHAVINLQDKPTR